MQYIMKPLVILIMLLVILQTCSNVSASSGSENEGQGLPLSRQGTDYIIDNVSLNGDYDGDQAAFLLNYTFYVYYNNTLEIPLIGPSKSAMAGDLTVDGVKQRVQFSDSHYYFKGLLADGEHELSFSFFSKPLPDDIKVLNYELFGPALIYEVEFNIPVSKAKKIYIQDNGDGIIIDEGDTTSIKWEYYATERVSWKLSWIEYISPTPANIRCDVIANTLIKKDKVEMNVEYSLSFHGYGFEKLSVGLDENTYLKSIDQGTMISSNDGVMIDFSWLIKDEITLNLVFVKDIENELKLSLPRLGNFPFNGKFTVFSDTAWLVQLTDITDATVLGYPGSLYENAYFVGSYQINDGSELQFNLSKRGTKLTADIIETVTPTQGGFELEVLILLSFYGQNPSSITIDLLSGTDSISGSEPVIWVGDEGSVFFEDHNWDGSLRRLTLLITSNLTGDYVLGIKRSFTGEKVEMFSIAISDFQINNYFIVYYVEKGVGYDFDLKTGLAGTDYNSLIPKLRNYLRKDTNQDIYTAATGQYHTLFEIEKSSDLKMEIFFRTWISENSVDIKQTIRVSSDNLLVNYFGFSIPDDIYDIKVENSMSWGSQGDHLQIFTDSVNSDTMIFSIDSKLRAGVSRVQPFLPLEQADYEIYSMFGASSRLILNVSSTGAEQMNIDEMPQYFKNEIKTPKAVIIYHSTSVPVFNFEVEPYELDKSPSTIIEFAHITIISSVDGRNAIQAIYMVKNVEKQEMRLMLPENGVVWMVLVAGKPVPINQQNNILKVALIRSTLIGENIAFPVEIVYMITEPVSDLKFLIPSIDISVLNMKLYIGLPLSVNIIDPGKSNPSFEYEGHDTWRTVVEDHDLYDNLNTKYSDVVDAQLSTIRFDKDEIDDAYLYIGLEQNSYGPDPVYVKRIDDSGNTISNFTIDPYQFDQHDNSEVLSAAMRVNQGNYVVTNAGVSRKVTVIAGAKQQILFDSEEETVYTSAPPIYLQFPKSGKVFRFSTIFVKSSEELTITLVRGKLEDSATAGEKISNFFSDKLKPVDAVFILLVIIVIIVYYFIIIRPRKAGMRDQKTKQGSSDHREREAERVLDKKRTQKKILKKKSRTKNEDNLHGAPGDKEI